MNMILLHRRDSNWPSWTAVRLKGTLNCASQVIIEALVTVTVICNQDSFGPACKMVDTREEVLEAIGVLKWSSEVNVVVL